MELSRLQESLPKFVEVHHAVSVFVDLSHHKLDQCLYVSVGLLALFLTLCLSLGKPVLALVLAPQSVFLQLRL